MSASGGPGDAVRGAGQERHATRAGISRRGLVVAAGSALVLGAGGTALVLGRDPAPSAPPAPPPSAPADPSDEGARGGVDDAGVLREAEATAGVRLRGSPWEAWGTASPSAAPWDGLYVAWLLRAHGTDPSATSAADLLALVRERGETSRTPSRGALAFYRRGSSPDDLRVALVVSTAGSVRTLEGDHPVLLPPAERFVRRFPSPGPGLMTYGMPGYGA